MLIAGGGPAGCAAALTLLAYTKLRVVVLERTRYEGARPGETVSHSIGPILQYLGIWDGFLRQRHLPAYAMAAAWGQSAIRSRSFLFSGTGHGWHLDRVRFDRLMAEEVRLRGGTVICGRRPAIVVRENAKIFRVVAEDGEEFSAAYLIDTGGRRIELSRQLGARPIVVDRLIAATTYFDGFDPALEIHETLVEAVVDGWWFSAPLPQGQLSVAFFTDPEIFRAHRLTDPNAWTRHLTEARHTARRIGGIGRMGRIECHPCGSQRLEAAAGDGWIAGGDAAACFDPLASMGIGHALCSGIQAARAAHGHLSGDGRIRSAYVISVQRNFDRYLRLRAHYYGLERRWADSPFWARRQSSTTAPAD